MKFKKLVIRLLLEIWEDIYLTKPGVVHSPRGSKLYDDCWDFIKEAPDEGE